MENHKGDAALKVQEQRGNVAAAHENLGMFADRLQIEIGQKPDRSVSAPRAKNGPDFIVCEQIVDDLGPVLVLPGQVAVLGEDTLVEPDLESQGIQTADSLFQFFRLE